ncbi:MAG: acyl-CoA dehydratase activase [Bacillota bacterium]|nr:acyl-CoA dehydratase activase [Bacillota bacterium]
MYWLGIDIGSISTDMVLIDACGNVLEELYLRTGGEPVKVVREGLSALGEKYASNYVQGVGITGSGRNLGAAVAGADVVKNEITSHARAVAETDSDIRTVIEIGGQDSKIILMENGLVKDFAMNTVCAAGTGSFLDRQAGRMGITIEDLSDMAYEAADYVPIAGRCAVFAESDIIHKQQTGASESALMAGLCRALAATYLSNVAKGKKIEPGICFQGGVASNKGMRKAFEELLQQPIIVPEHHKVMGALGAALLAKDKKQAKTNFKGFETGRLELRTEETECRGCSNTCRVINIRTENEIYGCFGDICGRYSG